MAAARRGDGRACSCGTGRRWTDHVGGGRTCTVQTRVTAAAAAAEDGRGEGPAPQRVCAKSAACSGAATELARGRVPLMEGRSICRPHWFDEVAQRESWRETRLARVQPDRLEDRVSIGERNSSEGKN